jgi:hypothetical protein
MRPTRRPPRLPAAELRSRNGLLQPVVYELRRSSVSSAWGRQALSELKNPSTLPSNVRNAREGVRIQAGGERTRPSDVEGRKLTLAKERPAWHEPFLQPQAILLLRLFLHVSQ